MDNMKQGKRIIIHGATNGSNFGDILFAHIFSKVCQENESNMIDFWQGWGGIGVFLRNELNYRNCDPIKRVIKADIFIMMSGGYLGEDKHSIKETVKRYVRYFLPAHIMRLLGKEIYIIGVGGGPLHSKFLQRSAVKLLNSAKVVTVRDEETKEYFLKYGVKNKIYVTSDTAQVLYSDMVGQDEEIDTLCSSLNASKILLLHLIPASGHDEKIAKVIVPAVNRFCEEYPEYSVLCCCDGYFPDADPLKMQSYNAITAKTKSFYKYQDSQKLLRVIKNVDIIVTCKLHMGIVGASLNKSVVAFPFHLEKVERYYRQIGETDRCVHMSKASAECVYSKIKEYKDLPINLPPEIRELAKNNLKVLKKCSGTEVTNL